MTRMFSLVVLVTVLAACGGSDAGVEERVVVSGYAHAGPMCPVETMPPDPACADRPVEGAVILVRNSAGVVVAEPRTAADGTFSVELTPGTYTLIPQAVEGLMGTAPEQVITVGTVPLDGIDLSYDTGIR